jgi:hypothetical protein
MLFDLRGRGRRRTVQVLYAGLALLMGGGLVLFGVGGGFGGTGILNAVNERGGAGGASFSEEVKKYEKLTRAQPASVSAWEALTKAQLHTAAGEAYVVNGKLTGKGRELFNATARSWERYLALNPPKPSLELAKIMAERIFSEEGLNQPAGAVQALQVVVAAEPSNSSFYALLAEYAYKAKNPRVGDLATAKAIALAPAEQRARLKRELGAVKKNPSANAGEEALTGTTNGKTFTVHKAPNGGYTGKLPTTTPAPATSTSGTNGPATGTTTTKK